ncbi:MAG TPA: HlyD family efflux transporter periplasmic adaptor subunit, partial [Kofleriaceae bacterium]|nr:HlyD family efflux transporter periplasmic adaptor subunit [Kofleriaceae bacterium]
GLVLRKAAIRPALDALRLLVRERRRIFTPRRSALLAGGLALIAAPWLLPWPVHVDAGVVLVPAERADVRARTGGVVDRVLVAEGERVRRGQAVAVLRNEALTAARAIAEAELAAAEARLAALERGARPEEIALARRRAARAAGQHARSAREAALAARLARSQVGTGVAAEHERGEARVDGALSGAARAELALLEAGSRPEEIAEAQAERDRVAAVVAQLRADEAALTLVSPIDGVVATNRVHELVQTHLDRGERLLEIHNDDRFVAELRLPPWAPLDHVGEGAPVVLRPFGAPDQEIECRVDRVRDAAETGAASSASGSSIYGDRPVVAITTPFSLPRARAGMEGRARVYGESRTLAYAHLYLPLKRLLSIELWSLF